MPSIPESITATFTGARWGGVGQNAHASSSFRYHSFAAYGSVLSKPNATAGTASRQTAKHEDQGAFHGAWKLADTPAAKPRPGAQRTR